MIRLRNGRVLNYVFPSFGKKPQNAVLNPSHPINNKLIGCWMLGDVSSGTFRDLSLRKNDGVSRPTGQPGNAMGFLPSHHGGQANYFIASDTNAIDCGPAIPNDFNQATVVSVTAWFNWDGNASGGIIAGDYTFSGGYQLGLRGSDGAVSWNLDSVGNTFIMYSNTGTPKFATPNTWHFAGATYDGSLNAKLYFDDLVYSDTFNLGISPATSTFAIGSQPGGGSLAIGAALDNVRCYSGRVLSDDEMLSLFKIPYLGIYDASYNPLVGTSFNLGFHMPLSYWTEKGKANPGPFTGYTPQTPFVAPSPQQRFNPQWFGERNPFAGIGRRVI